MEVQEKFKEADAPVKFVEAENLHFTCKFFGEISDDKKEEIIEIIKAKIENYNAFKIDIKHTGVFPNSNYIKVVWLGLDDPGEFAGLLADFDMEFKNLGFKKERSHITHLTIGRVKGRKNKENLLKILKETEDVEVGSMEVNKLTLKKSELTPQGPVYTTVEEFQLK